MTSTLQRAFNAHVCELDHDGLTVLPPFLIRALGPQYVDLPDRLRKALLRLVGEAKAMEWHVQDGVQVVEVHDLLGADPVFDEAVAHPTVVALAESLLGEGFRLRNCSPIVVAAKRRMGQELHCDGSRAMLSCVWILTDYGQESGSLCYVPGSHRLARMPERGEGVDEAVAVEAEPGSLLAFDGFLWHGTWPRSVAGDRLAVHCSFTGASSGSL